MEEGEKRRFVDPASLKVSFKNHEKWTIFNIPFIELKHLEHFGSRPYWNPHPMDQRRIGR